MEQAITPGRVRGLDGSIMRGSVTTTNCRRRAMSWVSTERRLNAQMEKCHAWLGREWYVQVSSRPSNGNTTLLFVKSVWELFGQILARGLHLIRCSNAEASSALIYAYVPCFVGQLAQIDSRIWYG